MEILGNFLIVLFIIFAVLSKASKAKQKLKQAGQKLPATPLDFIVPNANKPAATPVISLLNNANLDKIVKVYGVGAMLSTDEVSILLNTDANSAQRYLDQLVTTGRAELVPASSGKMRYKLK